MGARTDPALHGFLPMQSSSTAAERIVDTFANSTRRYVADLIVVSDANQAWTVLGLIWTSVFDPSIG